MPETKTATRQAKKTPTDLSAASRRGAQQGAAFAKDVSDETKATTEETNKDAGEFYSVATSGATEFHRQWIAMVRANINSTFDFADRLLDVRSPSAFFELSAVHARKQIETLTKQAQLLAGLADQRGPR